MYSITKRFDFSASHILEGLPDGHQCGRLHGHNYAVEIELTGDLDPIGFVVDYGELGPVKALIDDQLDHRHLNDILPSNPTAEHLAFWLYIHTQAVLGVLPGYGTVARWCVSAVRVSETPKTWAEYRP